MPTTAYNVPVRQWFPPWISWWATCSYKLYPLYSHPRVVGGPVKSTMFKNLT